MPEIGRPQRAWLVRAHAPQCSISTQYLNDCKFILVSNREPYEHMHGEHGIEVKQPAGGLVSALDPTMRRTHGTWVAWGSGTADHEVADETGRVAVPPGEDCYTLRRVWLDDADVNGYYHGFANRALWPLCHMLIQHFEFRTEYWERYETVNLRFAHAVADEAERCTGRAMAWIQDYHFALAAEYLRAMQPSLFIHQFWHIPFPPADILRLLPAGTHQDVLRGLLGNDLVEFQIDRYAMNFLDCVDKYIPEARVDHVNLTIAFRDRIVQVGAFPISIDVERFERMARSADSEARIATLRGRYAKGTRQLGVCVDRVDYTKGIPERIRALETLWTESPELRERFTFIFVCTPSRSDLPAYNLLERDVTQSVIAINEKFGNAGLDADRADQRERRRRSARRRLSRGRSVYRVVAAGRNESRRQGIRRLPARRTRRAHSQPLHRIGRGDRRRRADQSVQRRRLRRSDSNVARPCRPMSDAGACIACVGICFHSTIFDWLDSILARATQVMGRATRASRADATVVSA